MRILATVPTIPLNGKWDKTYHIIVSPLGWDDVVKYYKNDFKRLKKIVSSTSTDELHHQNLKLYLHFTKKRQELIRVNLKYLGQRLC